MTSTEYAELARYRKRRKKRRWQEAKEARKFTKQAKHLASQCNKARVCVDDKSTAWAINFSIKEIAKACVQITEICYNARLMTVDEHQNFQNSLVQRRLTKNGKPLYKRKKIKSRQSAIRWGQKTEKKIVKLRRQGLRLTSRFHHYFKESEKKKIKTLLRFLNKYVQETSQNE